MNALGCCQELGRVVFCEEEMVDRGSYSLVSQLSIQSANPGDLLYSEPFGKLLVLQTQVLDLTFGLYFGEELGQTISRPVSNKRL